MKSAILLIVFNRPHTTRLVFDEIRKAKPSRLYIAADGPRSHKPDDYKKCEKVREILQEINWNCEVKTLFQKENLGCKIAVSTAINWFFKQEDEGIILEDDCLPSQSFFYFCDEQLSRFRTDNRIFLISGYNKQNSWKTDEANYFFSNYGGIWGWASWRRAWQHNDIEMLALDEYSRLKKFEHLLGDKQGKIRRQQMDAAKTGHGMSAWDYQWGFSRHVNSGMACVPSHSLIENIGFGEDATHTSINTSSIPVKRHEMKFPLKENIFIVPDRDYDELFFQNPSVLQKILSKLHQILRHKK